MDILSEHAIRMLEIVDNERGFYKDSEKDIADIARAVYDIILRLQVNEAKSKQADTPQTESLEQFRVGLEYHTDATHFGKAKGQSVTTDTADTPQTETHDLRTETHECVKQTD